MFSKFLFSHHLWCSVVCLWYVILYVDLFLIYLTQDLTSVFNLNIHAFFKSGKFSNIIPSYISFPLFPKLFPLSVSEINWNMSFFLSISAFTFSFLYLLMLQYQCVLYIYHFINFLFSTVQYNCLNIWDFNINELHYLIL